MKGKAREPRQGLQPLGTTLATLLSRRKRVALDLLTPQPNSGQTAPHAQECPSLAPEQHRPTFEENAESWDWQPCESENAWRINPNCVDYAHIGCWADFYRTRAKLPRCQKRVLAQKAPWAGERQPLVTTRISERTEGVGTSARRKPAATLCLCEAPGWQLWTPSSLLYCVDYWRPISSLGYSPPYEYLAQFVLPFASCVNVCPGMKQA